MTFDRCRALQFTDEDIRALCAKVLATAYYRHLILGQPFDPMEYARMLRRLPMLPWDDPDAPDTDQLSEAIVHRAIFENPNLLIETVEEALQRYRRVRTKLLSLHSDLMRLAGAAAVFASAVQLGLLHERQTLACLTNDHALAVATDHFLYADARRRFTRLERYRDLHKITEHSDEDELLLAMKGARFCLLHGKTTIPDYGIGVTDVSRGTSFPLIDLGLASMGIAEGVEELFLATRIIAPYGLQMTTGAALVVPNPDAWKEVITLLEQTQVLGSKDAFDAHDRSGKLSTAIQQILIRHGAERQTRTLPVSPAV